jgi:RNA polymerase sigma factor (sigma-70 family)
VRYLMETANERFEKIFLETNGKISRFVFFRVAQTRDAEDIVQEVYLRFYQRVLCKGKDISNPLSYLIEMSRNELKEYYRFRTNAPVFFQDQELNIIENIADESDVALETINRYTIDEIWEAVKRLDEIDQKILGGKFRFDMTFKEISEASAISENTVKTRYYRALGQLRKWLKEEEI